MSSFSRPVQYSMYSVFLTIFAPIISILVTRMPHKKRSICILHFEANFIYNTAVSSEYLWYYDCNIAVRSEYLWYYDPKKKESDNDIFFYLFFGGGGIFLYFALFFNFALVFHEFFSFLLL